MFVFKLRNGFKKRENMKLRVQNSRRRINLYFLLQTSTYSVSYINISTIYLRNIFFGFNLLLDNCRINNIEVYKQRNKIDGKRMFVRFILFILSDPTYR